jgi:hypothetical protein
MVGTFPGRVVGFIVGFVVGWVVGFTAVVPDLGGELFKKILVNAGYRMIPDKMIIIIINTTVILFALTYPRGSNVFTT